MDISVKGKTDQRLTIQMKDLLPSIMKAIKEDIGLPDDVELHYASNTTFLSFNVIRNDEHRERCHCNKCTLWRLNWIQEDDKENDETHCPECDSEDISKE